MIYNQLGKTGLKVSAISLGTWQIGGKWGDTFNDSIADRTLNEAIDSGINFIDTADVYSNGLSEKSIGRVLKTRKEQVFIATKCGRQLQPHINQSYQPAILRKFVEDSLKNLGLETLDLIQLHCPPTEVYYRPEIFDLFNDLKKEGKIKNLGISVEKVEEALKGIEFENVTTVQIIFNLFRQRPSELFFKEAAKKNVGIIVRVPLASGLLSGKLSSTSTFKNEDHRNFNRYGAAFDKGETFSGIDYETGLKAVNELKKLFPNVTNLAPIALKWILQFPEVSCIIPGASNAEQMQSNVSALSLPDFTSEQLTSIQEIYNSFIKKEVHQLW